MRGRRRIKYSWFPSLGTDVGPEVFDGETWAGTGGQLHITPGDADQSPIDIISLTYDYPAEVEEAAVVGAVPSLADFQGSEYQLERVVGKFFCAFDPIVGLPSPVIPTPWLVCAALMILRVNEETGAPVGVTGTDFQQYSPLVSPNISDPWIWRRCWMLSESYTVNSSGGFPIREVGIYPQNNTLYGDIESGPHVDARSVRRVRREERIFLVVQMCAMKDGIPGEVFEGQPSPFLQYSFDYRILGRLVKASAHGNTSR